LAAAAKLEIRVSDSRLELPRAAVESTDSTAASIVRLSRISKAFGSTLANAEIDLDVAEGEVIGLVGGNGAGKSTLMRILCGATPPTLGEISFGGERLPFSEFETTEAQRRGIRMVHQELSLCTNLSVAENFFLEAPGQAGLRPGWRKAYRAAAREALNAAFPENGIDVDAKVGHLSIGERQMVEIARAAAAPDLRLIVLDEPTSSLDQQRSRQLRDFVRRQVQGGRACIFISHKLHEILDVASRVVVLRNGRIAWQGRVGETSFGRLVELMGGNAEVVQRSTAGTSEGIGEVRVEVGGRFVPAGGEALALRAGEIVGLAGLEGHGQKEFLHAIYEAGKRDSGVVRHASASFISGDRQKEGVFPLWNVLANISIGRIAARRALGLVSVPREAEVASEHAGRLQLDRGRFGSNILELSGGNQQKALVARALVADTPIVLLDDPTRGVDITTKQDFYRLCSAAAQEGRTLVWHTTEDAELLACDRVLVFANGRIASQLVGAEISEQAIVGAAFAHLSGSTESTRRTRASPSRLARQLVDMAPFIGLVLVLAVMVAANNSVASVFGIDLLLLPALSLVLVTIAQMFVVGGSEIDLGVGSFAGLVSVLSATLLYDQPPLGIAAILAAVIAYAGLGGLIQARKIPAIVVTLGASFIWSGIGYSIQPTPGGTSPDWLAALVGWSLGFVPTSIILIAAVGVIALILDRLPIGVVLRGFGNNAAAMVRSGWRPTRYAVIRYLIAGLFAAAGGLSLTAINASSDINSGNSFTLLSVAAVVMGGCALIGGVISPIGAVVGAMTLSLIGALLGALNVSSDFNAATQGLVLIALLAMRSLTAERGDED
jgi:ribose transport system ATP-binding protein